MQSISYVNRRPLNFRTFDLNLLRVFDEVMRERNLTRAATNLALTQSAVSNALRRLRDALGDALLQRAGYGMQPTPYALSVWPQVREALEGLQRVLAPTDFNPASADGSFVLAMADATASLLMPPLLRLLTAEAPGVSLRVLPLTTRDPRGLLEDGSLDLAIGYFPLMFADMVQRQMSEASPSNFGDERLYGGRYVCVMRRDHPLSAGELSLEAYCQARHLLVSFSGRPFGFVDQALAALKRQRRIVLTVNQYFTAGQVVANSDLLTVMPERLVVSTGIAPALAVRPLPLSLPGFQVDMVWRQGGQQRPGLAWLRQRIAQCAADRPEA